jgi:hypothetical protein
VEISVARFIVEDDSGEEDELEDDEAARNSETIGEVKVV